MQKSIQYDLHIFAHAICQHLGQQMFFPFKYQL